MTLDIMPTKKVHQGRNVKRIREILGIKQDALAISLGEDWNQQKVSLLENREIIEQNTLENVANALGVSAEAILNFNEDATVNYIANTFNGNSGNYMNFNPIDKLIELYERLLDKEKQINELLKKNNDQH